MEYLPSDNQRFRIFKYNQIQVKYFLENSETGKLQELDENFKKSLNDELANKFVEGLIPITNKNDFSLPYLLQNDEKIKRVRTFSKPISIVGFLGAGPGTVQIPIYFLSTSVQQNIFQYSGGLGVEAFPTFKRNISISLTPNITGWNSYSFHSIRVRGSDTFETDLSLNWLGFQLPISAKYYLDIKPQKMRVFAEIGYAFSKTLQQDVSQTGAYITTTNVTLDKRQVYLSNQHQGTLFGFGGDIIRPQGRVITIALRSNKLESSNSDSAIEFFNFQISYKF
jgi:hypothetical protein